MKSKRRHGRIGFGVAAVAAGPVTLADGMLQLPPARFTSISHYLLVVLGAAVALSVVMGTLVGTASALSHRLQRSLGVAEPWSWFSGSSPNWVTPLLHAFMVSAGLFVLGQTWLIWDLRSTFANPFLASLLASLLGLAWLLLCAFAGGCAFAALAGKRLILSGRWMRLDPLGSPSAALHSWMLLGWAIVGAGLHWSEPFRIAFPLRLALAISLYLVIVAALGSAMARAMMGKRRFAALAGGLSCALLALFLVNDSGALFTAHKSPVLRSGIALLQSATDFDRDGFTSMLGGADCDPWDASVHPRARDVPNDGIDQNCSGFDYVPPPLRPADLTPSPWKPAQSSLLLITVDTMRLDHLSITGYARKTTPHLDAMARNGIWFERYYSTGNGTTEVLPALVSSSHYGQLPLGERIQSRAGFPRKLLPEAHTLAEQFRNEGIRTAQFAAMGYFPGWGIDQGFEHRVHAPQVREGYEMAPKLTDRAMKWIAELGPDERFFAWVHYYEPHRPYASHDGVASFGESEVDRYDDELRFVDREIGKWRQWLGTTKRGASTIVAVTSDHGELFGEMGLSGHGRLLFDVLVRVPLVLHVPGAPARRVAELASTIDLAPTLSVLLGAKPHPSWRGLSLLPAIAGQAGDQWNERVVFSADHSAQIFAAVRGWWKLVWYAEHNLFQLVDLHRDRAEQSDASAENADLARALKRELLEWHEWVVATSPDL